MYLAWLGKQLTKIYKDEVERLSALVLGSPIECAASLHRLIDKEVSYADLHDASVVVGESFKQLLARLPQSQSEEVMTRLNAASCEPYSRLLGLRTLAILWRDVEKVRLNEQNSQLLRDFKIILDETTSPTIGNAFLSGTDEECLVLLKCLPLARTRHLLGMISSERATNLLSFLEDPILELEEVLQTLTSRIKRIEVDQLDEQRRSKDAMRQLITRTSWSEEEPVLLALKSLKRGEVADLMRHKFLFHQLDCLPDSFLRECMRECSPEDAMTAVAQLPAGVRKKILMNRFVQANGQEAVRRLQDSGFARLKRKSEDHSVEALMAIVRRKIVANPQVCEVAAQNYLQSSNSIC